MANAAQFRYWDPTWWENYFKNDLYNLYVSAKCIVDYINALTNEVKASKDLRELLSKNREFWMKVFLGGINSECVRMLKVTDNCFPQNSLAYIYREVAGVYLKNDDIEILLSTLQGPNYEEAGKDLTVNITTELLLRDSIYRVYNTLSKIYGDIPVNCDTKLDDPVKIVNLLENFLNNAIKVLPVTNPVTFFIQSLHSTPRFYLKIAYGNDLFNQEVQGLFRKYGLTLRTLINTPNKDVDSDIVGYERNSVGEYITHMILDIYFIISRLRLLRIIDLDYDRRYFQKYIEKINGQIRKALIGNNAHEKFTGIKSSWRNDVYVTHSMVVDYEKMNVKIAGGEDCGECSEGLCILIDAKNPNANPFCAESSWCSVGTYKCDMYILNYLTFVRAFASAMYMGFILIDPANDGLHNYVLTVLTTG